MKGKARIFIVIGFMLFFVCTFTTVLKHFQGNSAHDYVIDNVVKTINVSEDNIYSVTDTIGIKFNSYDSYLYYDIPMYDENGIERKIYDIKVSSINTQLIEFSASKIDKNLRLKISSPYTNKDTISIQYKSENSEDFDETKDSFNFKLFDPNLTVSLNDLSFLVKFHKAISENSVNIELLPAYKEDFKYTVNNNTISGSYKGKKYGLMNEINLDVEFAEGFFNGERNYKTSNFYIVLGYIIITALFAILWFFKGKDDKVAANPVFTVPEGYNPLELGYWLDKSVEYSDMFYMVLAWANEGYIRIEKLSKSDDTNGNTNFSFKKIKDLDINKPEYEKKLFKAFFELEDEETTPGEFDTKSFRTVTDALFGTLQTYAQEVGEAEECFKEYVDKEETAGYDQSAENLFGAMKVGCVLLWIFAMYHYLPLNCFSFIDYMPIVASIIMLGFSLFVEKDAFFTYSLYVAPILILMSFMIIEPIVLVLILICLFLTGIVRKRTFKYNELLGKIHGFKNVICKKKYKMQVNNIAQNNSNYFYEVLPYAFVLFKEQQWKDQFEYIENPSWYTSRDGETLNKSNIGDFLKQIRAFGDDVLQIVNMSATADKKEKSREGLDYVSKSDRIKAAGLSVQDFENDNDLK